jgi:hypothetical protein
MEMPLVKTKQALHEIVSRDTGQLIAGGIQDETSQAAAGLA